MATPDFDFESGEVDWSIQQNYTPVDNDGQMHCGMTGFAKRRDEVVYRGQYIDHFYGFFTIGQDSAEQLAKLVGFIDPDTLVSTPDELLVVENQQLQAENDRLQTQIDELRSVLTVEQSA